MILIQHYIILSWVLQFPFGIKVTRCFGEGYWVAQGGPSLPEANGLYNRKGDVFDYFGSAFNKMKFRLCCPFLTIPPSYSTTIAELFFIRNQLCSQSPIQSCRSLQGRTDNSVWEIVMLSAHVDVLSMQHHVIKFVWNLTFYGNRHRFHR
jgi:hypothetical protein